MASRATAAPPPPFPARPARCSVEDPYHTWYEATIEVVEPTRVYVHYTYWTSAHDEWIEAGSPRLAPFGTRTCKWRCKMGRNMMRGFRLNFVRENERLGFGGLALRIYCAIPVSICTAATLIRWPPVPSFASAPPPSIWR
jgi:hypothetical protein